MVSATAITDNKTINNYLSLTANSKMLQDTTNGCVICRTGFIIELNPLKLHRKQQTRVVYNKGTFHGLLKTVTQKVTFTMHVLVYKLYVIEYPLQ
jgi:hypothetical protein